MNNKKRHAYISEILLVTMILLLAMAPVFITEFSPITDLPQILTQVQQYNKLQITINPELTIAPWYYPNNLIYHPMIVLSKFFNPMLTGKITIALILVISIISSYALTKIYNLSVASWILSNSLLFNISFYWGFISFLIGWPFFCLLLMTTKLKAHTGKTLITAAVLVLLYLSHSLWLLMGTTWLLISCINEGFHRLPRKMLELSPAWLLAQSWYPKMIANRSSSPIDLSARWQTNVTERLYLENLTDAALGGIPGSIEPIIIIIVVIWIATSAIQSRIIKTLTVSKPLYIAALVVLSAYIAFPDIYVNTIKFNKRWLAFGLILLLIALPQPKIKYVSNTILGAIGLICFISLLAATIKSWIDFNYEDADGFSESLQHIDESHRVLGLDYYRGSLNVKGQPTLQFFSYASAIKGAHPSFSFAEHYSGIVQANLHGKINKHRSYVAEPGLATEESVKEFDRIIMSGNDTQHSFWAKQLNLVQINKSETIWRTYQPK